MPRYLTDEQMVIRCAHKDYGRYLCARQPDHRYHLPGEDYDHDYVAPPPEEGRADG